LFGSNSGSEAEVQAWYHKMFDARVILDPVPNATKPVVAALIGDVEVKKGRAVERLGLEVKNLEALCKKLEASGVKFDKPFSKSNHASYASAEITDPWGTPIEFNPRD
jgi:glyoxalase/bleomycin resistance protein/dioxygenase superfamily protein